MPDPLGAEGRCGVAGQPGKDGGEHAGLAGRGASKIAPVATKGRTDV